MARPEVSRQPGLRSAVRDSDVDRDTHPILQCAEVVPLHPELDLFRAADASGGDDPDHTAIVEVGTATAPISIRPPARDENDRGAEWYVRLRLREDRLARLWVDGHTHKDILVWRDDLESWAPLLTVPQLRNAIHVQSTMAPPVPSVPAVVRREVAETAAASARPGATPSSCAPMVVDTDPVLIPAAPRLPNLEHFLPPETPLPALPLAPLGADWRAASAGLAAAGGRTRLADRLAALLPPGLQLSQVERLAWMAAVVAVSSFAVVTAGLRHREQLRTAAVAAALTPASATPVVAATPAPATSSSPADASPAGGATASTLAAAAAPRDAATPGNAPTRPVAGASGSGTSGRAPAGPSPTARAVAAAPRPAAGAALATRATPVSTATAAGGANGFDKNAARLAAISAAQRVGACTEEPASGVVVITFAPSGLVSNASIAALKGDSIRPDCVLRSFQAARINPFSGPPVTVQKSFVVK